MDIFPRRFVSDLSGENFIRLRIIKKCLLLLVFLSVFVFFKVTKRKVSSH
jgi:hypothetical protein